MIKGIFDIGELDHQIIKDLKKIADFCKEHVNFNDLKLFFEENNFKRWISFEVKFYGKNEFCYEFRNQCGKKYIGETTELFKRIYNYLKCDNINVNLKDDLNGNFKEFVFKLIPTDNCKLLERQLIRKEVYERASIFGIKAKSIEKNKYKLIYNTKLYLDATKPVRSAERKNMTNNQISKLKKDDFRGFGQLFFGDDI